MKNKSKNTNEVTAAPNDLKALVEVGTLSKDEQKTLDQCEHRIKKGLTAFHEVADAFYTILEKQLFRAEYKSSKEYCEKKWNFTRGNGYKYAKAGQVLKEMEESGATELPGSVGAGLILSDVPNAKRPELMTMAKETYGNTTAESLKKAKKDSGTTKPTPKAKATEIETHVEAQRGESGDTEPQTPTNVIPMSKAATPEGLKSLKELQEMAQETFDIAVDLTKANELTEILSELTNQLKLRAQWEENHRQQQAA